MEEYAEVICASLSESLATNGISSSDKTLEIEPGRACYADIGVHLSRVVNIKTESEPVPVCFVELDTTEMFLLDVHLEHNRWSQVVANRATEPATTVADLVGMSCGFDTIIPDAALPDVAPGDLVAFLDTGAYQEVTASNFNAIGRPATVLVRDGTARVVRRAETIEDVFRRDVDDTSIESG
jgi:diaminopimelate decarboxylase